MEVREPRCTQQPQQFTLPGLSEGESFEEGRDAPFGIEVGRAITVGSEHWVPFVRGGSSRGSAGVVRLGAGLEARLAELGDVIGDVPPPGLAGLGSRVFVALTESDARGGGYRLGLLRDSGPDWFGSVDQRGDDSPSFSLLTTESVGLFVWDDWDTALGHSVISLVRFDVQAPDGVEDLGSVSPAATDAEQPRLMSRPGGFWLSWVALGEAKPSEDSSSEPLVVPKHAWLEVMPLDASGKPTAEPLRVTDERGRVVAYDGLAAHDGSVLFAVRDGETPAELDDGQVQLIRVQADGSITKQVVEAPHLGASAPNLLYDTNPGGGAPHGWLVLASGGGTTMLAGLSPFGVPLEAATASSTLGTAGVLAAQRGELLVVRPRGRDAVFGLARCLVTDQPRDAGP